MESLGAISENEWSSFNTAMYSNEESQFMAQLFNDCSVPGEFHGGSCFIWPDHEYKSTTMVDIDSINSLDWNHIHAPNNDYMLSDYCMKEASNVLGNDEFLNREMILTLQETPLPCKEVELKHAVQKDRKRSYNVGDTAEKKKRVVKSRKSQKLNSSSKIDDDMKFEVPRQSSSSYSLDDDDELNAVSGGLPVALADTESVDTIGKKTRASKSSANDPQSIYARKRRERINERLRTLQNLVPNGTKVDISTMLEEAVQYVKFLQLQIKLLSSNDLWMYAPIAYNGMDLGLDLNTSMPRQQQ